MSDREYVSNFYRKDALKHGLSPFTAVHDDVLREKETTLITRFFDILAARRGHGEMRVLDVGCGNGHMVGVQSDRHPSFAFWGADASEEMIALSQSRNLKRIVFEVADSGLLHYDDGSFDAVYTERCLINIPDHDAKLKALAEIHRVLAKDGHYLMIEGFTDGLENNNRARQECGLPALKPAQHNEYFDKQVFLAWAADRFEIIAPEKFDEVVGDAVLESNFLSSHYFMSPIGDYSLIQASIFKKR